MDEESESVLIVSPSSEKTWLWGISGKKRGFCVWPYFFTIFLSVLRFHITNLEPYVSSSELIPEKIMLDPPEGFTDSLSNRKSNGKEEEIEEDSESCSTSASSGRDGVKGFGKSSQREGKLQAAKSSSNEYTISV